MTRSICGHKHHQGVSCSGVTVECWTAESAVMHDWNRSTPAEFYNNDHNNCFTSVHVVIFLPLSVTKKLDIVRIAAPFLVEKRCSSSSRMSRPSSLHSAFVLEPKPRVLGGGPHVKVTLFPKNTSRGSNCKGVRSSNSKWHISNTKAYFLTLDTLAETFGLSYCQKSWNSFLPAY